MGDEANSPSRKKKRIEETPTQREQEESAQSEQKKQDEKQNTEKAENKEQTKQEDKSVNQTVESKESKKQQERSGARNRSGTAAAAENIPSSEQRNITRESQQELLLPGSAQAIQAGATTSAVTPPVTPPITPPQAVAPAARDSPSAASSPPAPTPPAIQENDGAQPQEANDANDSNDALALVPVVSPPVLDDTDNIPSLQTLVSLVVSGLDRIDISVRNRTGMNRQRRQQRAQRPHPEHPQRPPVRINIQQVEQAVWGLEYIRHLSEDLAQTLEEFRNPPNFVGLSADERLENFDQRATRVEQLFELVDQQGNTITNGPNQSETVPKDPFQRPEIGEPSCAQAAQEKRVSLNCLSKCSKKASARRGHEVMLENEFRRRIVMKNLAALPAMNIFADVDYTSMPPVSQSALRAAIPGAIEEESQCSLTTSEVGSEESDMPPRSNQSDCSNADTTPREQTDSSSSSTTEKMNIQNFIHHLFQITLWAPQQAAHRILQRALWETSDFIKDGKLTDSAKKLLRQLRACNGCPAAHNSVGHYCKPSQTRRTHPLPRNFPTLTGFLEALMNHEIITANSYRRDTSEERIITGSASREMHPFYWRQVLLPLLPHLQIGTSQNSGFTYVPAGGDYSSRDSRRRMPPTARRNTPGKTSRRSSSSSTPAKSDSDDSNSGSKKKMSFTRRSTSKTPKKKARNSGSPSKTPRAKQRRLDKTQSENTTIPKTTTEAATVAMTSTPTEALSNITLGTDSPASSDGVSMEGAATSTATSRDYFRAQAERPSTSPVLDDQESRNQQPNLGIPSPPDTEESASRDISSSSGRLQSSSAMPSSNVDAVVNVASNSRGEAASSSGMPNPSAPRRRLGRTRQSFGDRPWVTSGEHRRYTSTPYPRPFIRAENQFPADLPPTVAGSPTQPSLSGFFLQSPPLATLTLRPMDLRPTLFSYRIRPYPNTGTILDIHEGVQMDPPIRPPPPFNPELEYERYSSSSSSSNHSPSPEEVPHIRTRAELEKHLRRQKLMRELIDENLRELDDSNYIFQQREHRISDIKEYQLRVKNLQEAAHRRLHTITCLRQEAFDRHSFRLENQRRRWLKERKESERVLHRKNRYRRLFRSRIPNLLQRRGEFMQKIDDFAAQLRIIRCVSEHTLRLIGELQEESRERSVRRHCIRAIIWRRRLIQLTELHHKHLGEPKSSSSTESERSQLRETCEAQDELFIAYDSLHSAVVEALEEEKRQKLREEAYDIIEMYGQMVSMRLLQITEVQTIAEEELDEVNAKVRANQRRHNSGQPPTLLEIVIEEEDLLQGAQINATLEQYKDASRLLRASQNVAKNLVRDLREQIQS